MSATSIPCEQACDDGSRRDGIKGKLLDVEPSEMARDWIYKCRSNGLSKTLELIRTVINSKLNEKR